MKPMTLPFARFALALLFVTAAVASWTAARLAEDLAARHQRIATLRSPDVYSSTWTSAAIERLVTANLNVADTQSGSLATHYWAGRYNTVAETTAQDAGDPATLLIAANAWFRKAQRETNGRPLSTGQLDQATQAYAGVLKNGGYQHDAAFNFEYVSRLRDTVAGSKAPAQRQAPPLAPTRDDDLPTGPTVHGRQGTHPPNTRGEEFEILTPMDYGEREAQPEATPGRPLPRKG